MRKTLAKHRVAMAVHPAHPFSSCRSLAKSSAPTVPKSTIPGTEFDVCPTQPATEVAAGFVANQNGSMDDLARADTVIILGCTNVHAQPPAQLIDAIRQAYRRHARIVGICSGAFVLAHAGLLDHRRATTHWMHIDDFAALFPAVILDPSVLYVEDAGVFHLSRDRRRHRPVPGARPPRPRCLRSQRGRPTHGDPAPSRRRPSPVPAMAHARPIPTRTWPRPCNGSRPTSTATSPSKT